MVRKHEKKWEEGVGGESGEWRTNPRPPNGVLYEEEDKAVFESSRWARFFLQHRRAIAGFK